MKMHKRLASVAIALAVLVIALGAYTRLTDAGLACPDWPVAMVPWPFPAPSMRNWRPSLIRPARLFLHKARSEMVHRYCAGVLGGVIVLLSGLGWRTGGRLRHLSLILLVLVGGSGGAGYVGR